MNKFNSTVCNVTAVLVLGAGMATGALAVAPDFMEKLQSPDRPAEDKVRDAARKPDQVMAELGTQEGWTFVDVSAGGGWYTEVLSAAVGPSGKVLMQVGPRALANGGAGAAAAQARADRLGNVEVMTVDMADMPAGTADAALTALNLHDAFNRGEESGKTFVQGIYNVLKSGGVAAIIDHEGTPGMSNGDLHRITVDDTRRLLESVGFVVVKESMVLDNPADDHTLGSHDDALERNTDRFLLIVRKP